MNAKSLLARTGIACTALCLFTLLSSCGISGSRNAADGRKVTDYKEYVITVASRQLPGVVTSCGNSYKTEVYAVKTEGSAQWEQMDYISGFDYEPGYEYVIRISMTSYLDWSMGEPAWTVYEFMELVSKTAGESENLPEDFIPEWFQQQEGEEGVLS